MAYNGKEIQEQLNKHGYNLDVDGIVGSKTTAAIKDFQQKNGLDVDGIVGNKTWAKLTGGNSGSLGGSLSNIGSQIINSVTGPVTGTVNNVLNNTNASNNPTSPTWDYTESDAVKQNWADYEQLKTQKPGDYNGTWLDTLGETINQIMNREKFSYDLNGDALYQQYKDQYTTQGKMAMMDTMGQAAAMTGGYGNSYAQSVGQQAYQGYLQQLNDKVPELYQLALNQYNQAGQDLRDRAGLLYQMDEQEYGRNQDDKDNYYRELSVLFENAKYMDEKEFNEALQNFNIQYTQYRDEVSDNQWKQSFQYQKDRDSVEDDHWQKTFDESVRQFGLSYNNGGSQDNESNDSGSGTDSVSENVQNKAAGYTDNTDLANYLDGLVDSGVISEEQADALYAENKQADQVALNKRSWKLVSGGGINWFWGIDNDAVVKDQYGNEYRMDKLVNALVAEGMTKKDAQAYVKNLQSKLGA